MFIYQFHKISVCTADNHSCVCVYLWTCSPIFDLAGVEALLVRVFHAGKDSCAAEAHWVDGILIMEQHSVCDDLESGQKCGFTLTASLHSRWPVLYVQCCCGKMT